MGENSICYTDGKSTKELISSLVNEGVNLNITAIFTIDQIKKLLTLLKTPKLSVNFQVEFMT